METLGPLKDEELLRQLFDHFGGMPLGCALKNKLASIKATHAH